MLCRALFLLIALGGLAHAKKDPVAEKFRAFMKESISEQWPVETLSENRVLMVRQFARHDCHDSVRWLMKNAVAKETAADVVREAIEVLSKYKTKFARQALVAQWRELKKPIETRALALSAFNRMPDLDVLPAFELAFADKDPRVVAAACLAAARSKRRSLLPQIEAVLRHKHRAARGAALRALRILGADEMLPQVYRVFLSDASARVRWDAWRTLNKLALEEFPPAGAVWRKWHEKQRAEAGEAELARWQAHVPKPHKEAGQYGRFFHIPILGDRVVFLLDITDGFDQPWSVDHAAQRKLPKEKRIPNFFGVKTRWDLVVAWVGECLKGLPPSTQVAFVFFNQDTTPWPEGKFLKLKGKTRAKIVAHLKAVERTGTTAMWEAFAAGFGHLAGGKAQKNFDKGADTLVFVTDGKPTDGKFAKRADRTIDEVWRLAAARQVAIHTVGIHYHDYEMCKKIAEFSGGIYAHVQQAGDTTEPQDLDFWPAKKRAFEEARKKKRRRGSG